MKGSQCAKKSTVNEGLVMVPPKDTAIKSSSAQSHLDPAEKSKFVYLTTSKQHKRAGSTGTTADEYTTDDEDDNIDTDEPDISIKDHVTRKLFHTQHNQDVNTFSTYSTIATIADKVHTNVMHRNSSDSSVYSDLGLEKCDEVEPFSEHNSPELSGEAGDHCVSCGRTPWSRVEFKQQAYLRLQNELKEANQELKQRDEELVRLSRIRQDVEAELEDLTASLFQEAHNMVRDANEKQANAEKALKESEMKVDVLSAEVAALKTLVLTSTPSHPNPHLHPQIDPRGTKDEFIKKHRRSPSHFNLKYGRENSPPGSPVKEEIVQIASDFEARDGLEVDPVLHKEFLAWRQQPALDKENSFVQRIYREDINLSLAFSNEELSRKVVTAVEGGIILVEAVRDKSKAMFPKKCALLEVPKLCFYRMNLGESDTWYSISQICRNRITSVCDFLNYLKYIERGLVKSSAHDIYWEIIKLRKNMVIARLGLSVAS